MKHSLALALLCISSVGFGQRDSLVITTDIPVDWVYAFNRKLDLLQANDSLLLTGIDRNSASDGTLILYSGQKRYETQLSTDPVADFPGEWNARDPRFGITIRMSVKKGQGVVSRGDGSATNRMSSLSVYGPSGELILEESYGVVVLPEKKRGKRKS